MTTSGCDGDADGWLDVAELRVSVTRSVGLLTNGRQTPTIDRLNP